MLGIPVKFLCEAEGHIVTCETKTGEIYRGKLIELDGNMNCRMTEVSVMYRDRRVTSLDHIYIRGATICMLILPDILQHAPMLKRQETKGNAGAGSTDVGNRPQWTEDEDLE